MPDEHREWTERVTLTLSIEDVTKAQRDEFIARLVGGEVEIEVPLGDGLAYYATVMEGQRA